MHFASVDFIHMHSTPRSSDTKMNRLGLKEEPTISIKRESSQFNANQSNIVLLYNKPSYQPYIGLNNSTQIINHQIKPKAMLSAWPRERTLCKDHPHIQARLLSTATLLYWNNDPTAPTSRPSSQKSISCRPRQKL